LALDRVELDAPHCACADRRNSGLLQHALARLWDCEMIRDLLCLLAAGIARTAELAHALDVTMAMVQQVLED
jgi:hypothetical protein